MRGAPASALADVNEKVELALGSMIRSIFEGFQAVEDKIAEMEEDKEAEAKGEVIEDRRGDIDLLGYIKSTVNVVGQELRNCLAAHPPDDRGWMKTKHVQMLTCCDAMYAWCDAGNADAVLAAEHQEDDIIYEWLQVAVGKMPENGLEIRAARGFLQTLHEIMHPDTKGSRRRHAMENFCAMVDIEEWDGA